MQETRQEKQARLTADAMRMLATRTIKDLVNIFEILNMMLDTNKSKQKRSELLMTYGWVCDELENRNAEAFNAFLDSDEKSPRKFFLA